MEKKTEVAKQEQNITTQVLTKIQSFQEAKELTLPLNYSPENALKNAWLILQETVDMNKKPVLEVCSKNSIANCLLDMVLQGLSPLKKQCYFIAYGSKLTLSRSYLGTIAVAKRVANVKEVRANCVYDKDDFEYAIDTDTGRMKIVKHVPSLANIDNDKIIGAYAIVIYNDNTTSLEVMNMKQIQTSWEQGKSKGVSPAHKNFKDEMSKKSVINRALKVVIGSSDDGDIYESTDIIPPTTSETVNDEVEENANNETLSFDDAEEVKEEIATEEPKESAMQPSIDF